jgi:two-component system response regulator
MRRNSRILIIEDNADDEVLLMRQLEKAGLDEHVRVIRDGKEALHYLTDPNEASDQLAAVFLDLKLPRLSGLKLLEAIRENERTAALPVIVMTSSNSLEDLEVCRVLGVSCFVTKPLTISSFAKAFADTFQARQSFDITPSRY